MQKLVWQNANGVELDLTSGNYGITEWEGFSNASLNIQQQQVPFQDGGVFLDALIEQRELSVTLAMQDNNNLELRYQNRRELISALNPKLGEGYLIYTNDFISKRIKCIPQIPLFETHNSDTVGTPKASLSWTACNPYWEDLEDTKIILQKGQIKSITNNGDIPVGFVFEGGVGNSINNYIKNETTNKKITIDIENEIFRINTNVGNKKSETLKYNNKQIKTTSAYNKIDFIDFVGKYLMIGNNGLILTSIDKVNWKQEKSDTTNDLLSFAYSNQQGVIFIVGANGTILKSSDCEKWELQESGVTIQLNDIIIKDDTAIAVGNNGTILTTNDNISWNIANSGTSSHLKSIIYSEVIQQYIVVEDLQNILLSQDLTTWTEQSIDENLQGFRIKEINNLIFIVGHKLSSKGYILKSSDCINWTSIEVGINGTYLYDIEYYNNSYYVCGEYISSRYNSILKSSDAENYEIITNDELYGMKQKYLKSYNGVLNILKDNSLCILNNNEFTQNSLNSCFKKLYKLCKHNENSIIAVGAENIYGDGNKAIFCSTDNIYFNKVASYNFNLRDITYSSKINKYIVCGDNNNLIISETGIDGWEVLQLEISGQIQKIYELQNNIYLICGGSNYLRIYILNNDYSALLVWESEQYTGTIISYSLTNKDNMMYILCTIGNVRYICNFNGNTATMNLLGDNYITDIKYIDFLNLFIRIGGTNLFISEDANNWTSISSEASGSLMSISASESLGIVVIVGTNSVIYSINGKNWMSADTITDELQAAIAYKNKYYIAGKGFYIISFIDDENIVSKISGDIGMTLNVGNNDIQLYAQTDYINGSLSFRQKYVGV